MDPFVERLVDAYNSRTPEAFDALLTDDVVLVRDEEKARGREEFKGVLGRVRRAFPDIRYRIEDVIRTGDRLVLRWEARGTHEGEYLGIQPSGRAINYTGITLYELRDGKIARIWVSADLLSAPPAAQGRARGHGGGAGPDPAAAASQRRQDRPSQAPPRPRLNSCCPPTTAAGSASGGPRPPR